MNIEITDWYERYRKPLRKWICSRNMVPYADVDDLVQDVFVRWLRYGDGKSVEYPQTYLCRIAAHIASEQRELARNRYPHRSVWLDEIEVEETRLPEQLLKREDSCRAVERAISQLPLGQQQTVRLHMSGLTHKQIAVHERLARHTPAKNLTRAYSTLRGQLSGALP